MLIKYSGNIRLQNLFNGHILNLHCKTGPYKKYTTPRIPRDGRKRLQVLPSFPLHFVGVATTVVMTVVGKTTNG